MQYYNAKTGTIKLPCNVALNENAEPQELKNITCLPSLHMRGSRLNI